MSKYEDNNKLGKIIGYIRTVAIIAGMVWYYHTAEADVELYNNRAIVTIGWVILSGALLLSVLANFNVSIKLPKKLHDRLSDWFDKIQSK